MAQVRTGNSVSSGLPPLPPGVFEVQAGAPAAGSVTVGSPTPSSLPPLPPGVFEVQAAGLPQQTQTTSGFQAPPQTAVSPVKPVAVATSAVPAAGAPSYTDIVLDTAKRTFDPLGITAPFIKGAVGSVGTAYENVLGTAQAGARLKENADVAFNRVLYGEPQGDTHAVSKAIGRAKDWSPLNAEQQAAYDKFKQRTPLKDVTLSTLPATAAQLVGEQVPQYGLTIAGTLLGGPVGGLLMSGLTQVGARYNENLKKGVDTPGSSFFVGGLQSALDALGPWLAVKGITKGLLSTAGAEGGTELVQEILAILHEKFYDIPQDDVFWRLMENFLAGLFLGGAAHVAFHPGKAPTPPPAAVPPLPPGVTEVPPAPVVPRMAGTNAPAFQAAPPTPTGPFASRIPTPTAPRAGPPLTAVPKLEGTNAPQFQGAPPTPTGPYASRVPTPTQPPIQGPAVRPPYEPVPAEGAEGHPHAGSLPGSRIRRSLRVNGSEADAARRPDESCRAVGAGSHEGEPGSAAGHRDAAGIASRRSGRGVARRSAGRGEPNSVHTAGSGASE